MKIMTSVLVGGRMDYENTLSQLQKENRKIILFIVKIILNEMNIKLKLMNFL